MLHHPKAPCDIREVALDVFDTTESDWQTRENIKRGWPHISHVYSAQRTDVRNRWWAWVRGSANVFLGPLKLYVLGNFSSGEPFKNIHFGLSVWISYLTFREGPWYVVGQFDLYCAQNHLLVFRPPVNATLTLLRVWILNAYEIGRIWVNTLCYECETKSY
jgi:hypothetical protein